MASDFSFPERYRLWKRHDLAHHEDLVSLRPWFYGGLREEDETRVWKFIEENYLSKYREILAVRFDWASSGLWDIPFPGSVSDTANIGCLEDMGLTEKAKTLLKEWHDELDARPYDIEEDEGFDYEASAKKGLAAAKEVKLSLGEDMYVEFEYFQEISVENGEAVEMEVPEFIRRFSGGK